MAAPIFSACLSVSFSVREIHAGVTFGPRLRSELIVMRYAHALASFLVMGSDTGED